jgi:addiction module HigA family antidote
MIESFAHKGLRRLFEKDDSRALNPEHVEKITLILAALDAAATVEAMNLPSFRLHRLTGNLRGFWAVTVRANWADHLPIRRRRCVRCRPSRLSLEREERPMQMKNPAHPGRLIKNELNEMGISVAAAAESLGVTRQQLYNVINGKSAVTPEMAVRLEQAIGSTADTWLRMQIAYDLAQIRLRRNEIKVKKLAPRVA